MKHIFRYLIERDADFAIVSAFEKNKEVRQLFLEGFRDVDSKIIEVRHSYMQQEEGYGVGESDIVFFMEDNKGPFAILIEDKIKANAQPNQAERYKVRAKNIELNCQKLGEANTRIFLCAPSNYLSPDSINVRGYDHLIAYEQIVNLLPPNSLEKSVLEQASSEGSCVVPDAGVTNFWKGMRSFVETYYNGKLHMKGKNGNKPSGSVWQEFETGIEGCILVMKIDQRKIALEFKQMGVRKDELNDLFKKLGIKHEAIRTNKGKSVSASIQIDIDEQYGMFCASSFEEQKAKAAVWIENALKLMEVVSTLKNSNITSFPLM